MTWARSALLLAFAVLALGSAAARAQVYPSPTYQNLTVLGTCTGCGSGTIAGLVAGEIPVAGGPDSLVSSVPYGINGANTLLMTGPTGFIASSVIPLGSSSAAGAILCGTGTVCINGVLTVTAGGGNVSSPGGGFTVGDLVYASNIPGTGILDSGILYTNVATLNGSQTFIGANNFVGGLQAGGVPVLTGNQTINLSGAVSGSGATAISTALGTAVVGTANIAAGAVTYAKIQNLQPQTLLGNPTSGVNPAVEITLGPNCSFTGSTFNCGGGSGAVSSVTGTPGQVSVTPSTGAVTVGLPSTITQATNFSAGLQSGGVNVLTSLPSVSNAQFLGYGAGSGSGTAQAVTMAAGAGIGFSCSLQTCTITATSSISGLTVGQIGIAASPTSLGSSIPYSASGAASALVEANASGFIANSLISGLPVSALATASMTVNGTTCTLAASCTPPAPAGTLTGSTLAAGVLGSSLTSVGALAAGSITTGFGSITTANAITGSQLISTVNSPTPPLVVSSTTNVPNLNASLLNGSTFASPSPIGSTAPNTGAFTTLSASSTVSGAGITALFAAPPAIGGTTPNTAIFTNLTASGVVTVSGIGSGSCSSGVAVNASNQFITTSCPGSGGGNVVGSGASTIGDLLTANNTGATLNTAVDSGIPASSIVLLTGPQTITGIKTFSAAPVISSITNTGVLTLPTTTGVILESTGTNTVTGTLNVTGTLEQAGSTISLGGNLTTAAPFTQTGVGAMTLAGPSSSAIFTMPGASTALAGLSTAETFTAAQTFTNNDFLLLGSSTGATTLASANASASNFTITFPAATDTVALLAATQALTNKTYNGLTITASTGIVTVANGKTLTDTSGVGAVLLLGATGGGFTAYAGASCTNQLLSALSAAGAGTCSSIVNADLTAGTFANITGVGTLTAGATGAGFTIALSASTVTGNLPAAAMTTNLGSALATVLGSTRGSTAEYGVSGWTGVPPSSTSGWVWTSAGTGADPSWQPPTGTTTMTLGPGLGNSASTFNGLAALQTVTNGSTIYSQAGSVAKSGAYTLNADCNSGANLCDTQRLVFANGTTSIAITAPNPAGTLGSYQISDEAGHGFTVPTAGGTATFAGCVTGAPTTLTVPAGFTVQLFDQGSTANSYMCTLASNLGGALASALSGTVPAANMLPLPNGDVYYGNGSSQPVATSLATLLASPPAIGGTAAAAGSFNGLTATGSFTATGLVTTADLANSAVTYAKIQNVAAVSLLGNPTGSAAVASEIPLGAGLSFVGGALTASGATITTNRITTGTTNTLSSITNNFTTELWVSASTGAKSETVPACASPINNYYLIESDGQGTAGTYPITVTPVSGSIGTGSSFTLAANGYTVVFQCDAPSTTWRIVASNQAGSAVRYAAATTLTIGAGDNGNVISQSNASAVAATIAQAGSAGFPEGGYYTIIQNTGAGAITVTPATSTINTLTAVTIPGGTTASPTGELIFADLVGNYVGIPLGGSSAGGITGSAAGTVMVSPGPSGTATGLAESNGNFVYGTGGIWTSASLATVLASPPAIGGTTPSTGNFSGLTLNSVKVPQVEQETAGWVAGGNPNNAVLVADLPYAVTLTSITARIETAVGAAATVTVWSAPSGTACGSGTNLGGSTSINANGTAATNQSLTLATTSVPAGASICLQTTGSGWAAGSGAGSITARWNPT